MRLMPRLDHREAEFSQQQLRVSCYELQTRGAQSPSSRRNLIRPHGSSLNGGLPRDVFNNNS